MYDESSDRIHRLNASAALVWRHADGTRTTADLAALLAERLGLPADEALVQIALEDLGGADLLATPVTAEHATAAISRRQALERLAAVAALIPAVASIVAPTPLAAQSSTTAPTGSGGGSGSGGTTTPGIVPRAGQYAGVSRLESQTCNPPFFGPQFTGTCTFNTGAYPVHDRRPEWDAARVHGLGQRQHVHGFRKRKRYDRADRHLGSHVHMDVEYNDQRQGNDHVAVKKQLQRTLRHDVQPAVARRSRVSPCGAPGCV